MGAMLSSSVCSKGGAAQAVAWPRADKSDEKESEEEEHPFLGAMGGRPCDCWRDFSAEDGARVWVAAWPAEPPEGCDDDELPDCGEADDPWWLLELFERRNQLAGDEESKEWGQEGIRRAQREQGRFRPGPRAQNTPFDVEHRSSRPSAVGKELQSTTVRPESVR
jgi:hypothetical protein